MVGNGLVRSRADETDQLGSASWMDSRLVFDHRHWRCVEAEVRWTAPHHLFVLTEQGGTAQTHLECDGRQIYEGRDRAGVFTFIPALSERRGVYREANLIYSALWVDPRLQEGWSGCEKLSSLPVFANHSDPTIAALIRSLRADISNRDVPSQVYVEHLAALLLLHIAAMSGRRSDARSAG